MRGIDLFAGAEGTTTGAKVSGVETLWAKRLQLIDLRC